MTSTLNIKAGRRLALVSLFCRMVARWKGKLKAKLRDRCFADYKWITRAQVQAALCCKMWEYRDDSIVSQRVRQALMEVREDIDPAMRQNKQITNS